MAIVLPPPSPAGSPSATSYSSSPPVLGGCASCCVRKYCARYAPASAAPPANCPFGPGPAAQHRN